MMIGREQTAAALTYSVCELEVAQKPKSSKVSAFSEPDLIVFPRSLNL